MSENHRKIWITGASSGIGKAVAEKFAKEGERLIPGFKDLTIAAQGGPATILAEMGVNVRRAFLDANDAAIKEVVRQYNQVADIGQQMGKAFDIRELINVVKPLLKKVQSYEDLAPDKSSAQAFRIINDDSIEAVVEDPTGVVRA